MKRLALALLLASRVAHAAPDEQPSSDDRLTYALFGGAAVFGIFALGETEVALRMQDEAETYLPGAMQGDPIFQHDYATALGQRDDARRNAIIGGSGMLVLAGLGTWRAIEHPPSPGWFDTSWKIRAGCDAVAIAAYAVAASLPYDTPPGGDGHISDDAVYLGVFSIATYGLCAPIVHGVYGDETSAGLSLATNVALPVATYYGSALLGLDNRIVYRPDSAPLWIGPVAAMAIDLFMFGKLGGEHAVTVEPRAQGGVVSFGGRF